MIFQAEFNELEAKYKNLHIHVAMSNPGEEKWSAYKGRISRDFVRACVPDIPSSRVHICGPVLMMNTVKSLMLELGVANENIKLEAFGTENRNPTLGKASGNEKQFKVMFSQSNKSIRWSSEETVLDGADSCGVEILNDCRSGSCGTCVARLVSGEVVMTNAEILSDEDKAEGYILTCQAKPKSDIEVEA